MRTVNSFGFEDSTGMNTLPYYPNIPTRTNHFTTTRQSPCVPGRQWHHMSSTIGSIKDLGLALPDDYFLQISTGQKARRVSPWEAELLSKRKFLNEKLPLKKGLAFLSPSVYFFFAWLFQWGHAGDLQNAAIPITLSLAPLATFWGFVLSTSPRFDNTRTL
ncbi:hypothetical protein N7517_004612 [Penicillium concentricum]|uniref:Uncharacterized protein n=1 Tax=Penicillium concentricum TaxID=293559 RepID=A0A9W9S5U1_9EURO|nr:uncharacterized protein N7517_004612 [Penicillium concentricum]KAJ5372606.1 hypothetical protein N7517_004612 [Penicillium concentricum]